MDFADGGRQSGSDSTNDQAIPNDGPPQAPTHPQIAEQPPRFRVPQLQGQKWRLKKCCPKKSILIEIVAFTESRPVAFPDHADRTLLSARLFPSSRCSASRDSCTPASASGLATFEPWA